MHSCEPPPRCVACHMEQPGSCEDVSNATLHLYRQPSEIRVLDMTNTCGCRSGKGKRHGNLRKPQEKRIPVWSFLCTGCCTGQYQKHGVVTGS
eukprot:scaffold47693_cov17-Tisochrysis_lutea.AAC.2